MMQGNGMRDYWNHNTTFHNEIVEDSKKRGGRVLDIGCGDGLLLQRLVPYTQQVVGIDPDEKIILRAQARLASVSNVKLIIGDFLTLPIPSQHEHYSTIICVATLHHIELKTALLKMRQVLAPGGRILIIGLAKNKSIMDFFISGLLLLPIRIMDRVHGGMQGIGVRTAAPKESLSEIRQVAHDVLPGAIIRRRFYYRYLLTWDKPNDINE
jgi:ubiquinone/menaquinone biosynthesis C-methylase UbiE